MLTAEGIVRVPERFCYQKDQDLHELVEKIYKNVKITSVEELKGGITNRLFKVQLELLTNGDNPNCVLVKQFGRKTELYLNRPREVSNFVMLSKHKLSGRLLAVFDNGYVYEYVKGAVLTPKDLPGNKEAIARELFKWHSTVPVGNAKCTLYDTLRLFLSKSRLQDGKRQQLYTELIKKYELKYADEPVVFCHNDLLAANIIKTPHNSGVKFIDYDYANYGPAAFDIANHFCEYGGFACEWAKMPSEDGMLAFLNSYNPDSSRDLLGKVKAFIPLAHLAWGLWALVQAEISEIDFDYVGYAEKRLAMVEFHDTTI